jgi:hypothetical protein
MRIYDEPIRIPVNPQPIPSRDLEKKLLTYASAAAAAGACVLAAAQPAQARVVVTHTNETINFQKHTKLDLNNDGIPDFAFASDVQFCCSTDLVIAPFKFNQIMGDYLASALASGVTVGLDNKFQGQKEVMLNAFINRTSGTTAYGGPFQDLQNRYLGLAFHINGQLHFGWARISNSGSGFGVTTLTEYAYESVPGKAIVTGATGDGESSDEETSQATPTTKSLPPVLGVLATGAAGLGLWRNLE